MQLLYMCSATILEQQNYMKVCLLHRKTSFVSHKVIMKWSMNHWPYFSLIAILFQTVGEWSLFILVCLNLCVGGLII
jgi:hypothetical protein